VDFDPKSSSSNGSDLLWGLKKVVMPGLFPASAIEVFSNDSGGASSLDSLDSTSDPKLFFVIEDDPLAIEIHGKELQLIYDSKEECSYSTPLASKMHKKNYD
jgi:hypothetical protein